MKNYSEKDEKGREEFKLFCHQQQWCKHHKDSKNQMDHWDLSYFSGNTAMIGEIKIRNYHSTDFDSWILQLDKLNWLKNMNRFLKTKGKFTRITYINHFLDGKTIIWDLTDLNLFDYDIEQRWLQKNDFTDEYEWKDVIFLKSSDAIYGSREKDLMQLLEENITNDDEDDDGLPF